MTGMGMQHDWKAILLAVLAALWLAVSSSALAQEDREQEETRPTKTLDPRVARELIEAYEALKEDKFREGVSRLDSLLANRGDTMKPFDLASVLQIRGSALVNLDRYDEALRDFERALKLDALPPDQNTQLRFNVAQLHFQAENYGEAIRHLKRWIREVEEPGHNAYYMLAAAYYYQDDYRAAVPYAQRALQLSPEPNRRYYDLCNILYSQLGRQAKRAQLLERMVTHWPSEKSYWKQLAAIYNELGRERKSFSTLELAYRNGLIDEADDILSLAQFYSVYNNPHRGAELLVKEMERGRIERNVDNLELLSQLWSQAREHKKAIPVLKEAARLSDTGELSFRLGQVLLADERYAEAERALEAALNKGGLEDDDRADAWMLLGSARFNQAGPGDKAKRAEADEAFRMAQRFGRTRDRATEWRGYIAAINKTERRQAALEAQQEQELAEAARERALTSCRAQRLSGSPLSQECKALFAKDEAAHDAGGQEETDGGDEGGEAESTP